LRRGFLEEADFLEARLFQEAFQPRSLLLTEPSLSPLAADHSNAPDIEYETLHLLRALSGCISTGRSAVLRPVRPAMRAS
jgi:hypothetical protein